MIDVYLFLNGLPPNPLPKISKESIIFCTDGAYNYLKKGLKPHVITGDMDSITDGAMDGIEVITTEDQDFTDFEKALDVIEKRGFKTVHIYGGSGLQQDHFLGNLHVAIKYKNRLQLTFFDAEGCYFFLDKKTHLKNIKNKTISLIPFPKAEGVITKGLLYPLNNQSLSFETQLSIRNTANTNDVLINFQSGSLLAFILG